MTQLAGDFSRLEHALSAALVLTDVAATSGDRVGAMVFDQEVLAFVPRESLVSSVSFCEPTAQRRIAAALDRLSEKERRVFVLYEMEGLPGKQVAEIVGCTEATLWRRLHEARQVFRQALAATEVAP